MAAMLGLSMLVKVDATGTGTFTTIGGGQTVSMRINQEMVDITSQDDVGRWRNALAGGGVRNIAVTLEGVHKDASVDNTLRLYAMNDTQREFQVVIPGAGTYEGVYQVASYENTGEHNGEVRYSLSLESAAPITYTSA